MRAQLIPTDGGNAIEITRDLTVVGRKDECDLKLDHKSVSKLHCIIVKTDGLLLLRDLGSTNGTRVNGQRVRRAALLPNDQLSIANHKFRVHLGPDEEPRASPSEKTQCLDSQDVAKLLDDVRKRQSKPDESSAEMPALPPQLNPLPDVYEENPDKR